MGPVCNSSEDGEDGEPSEEKAVAGLDPLLESLSRLRLRPEAPEVPVVPLPAVQPAGQAPSAEEGPSGGPAERLPPANQAQAAGKLLYNGYEDAPAAAAVSCQRR